jgi:hypothetical protein
MFRIIRTLICLGLAVAVLADTHPGAQTRKKRGEVDMKGETIVASKANLEKMATQLRVADTRIMDYVRDSMKAIEAGHRTGFQHFAVWYRNYEHAKETSTAEVMAGIIKEMVGKAIELAFPETTPFVEAFKFTAKQSMDVALKAIQPAPKDVNLTLERLRTTEEEYIKGLLDTPTQFRKMYSNEIEAAKWEYVETWLENETATGQELPGTVQSMLDTLGVVKTGASSATRVAEAVLAAHIHTVYVNDDAFLQGIGGINGCCSTWAFARSTALRKMDLKGNTVRICDIERNGMSDFFRSIPAKECRAAGSS